MAQEELSRHRAPGDTVRGAEPDGAEPPLADAAFPAGREGAGTRREPDLGDRLVELFVKHRWATVVPIVLPLSKAFEAYWTLSNVYLREWRNAAAKHGERVAEVQRQIRAWNDAGRPGPLATSRKAWLSVAVRASEYKKHSFGIDVDLHDILGLDLERRTVRVEPRVNMGQLTRKLVPMGLTLPVVPELDDLTAGGLFLGYGMETSAHKYGLFSDTVVGAEVVLADGRVVRCSATEHPDLFRALPWSHGSLGILTALEIQVRPCRPYVRHQVRQVRGMEAICQAFADTISGDDPPEFVEGLLFDHDRGVILTGDFADRPPDVPANDFSDWRKPWFYKYVESAPDGQVDYIPLRAYYHRHTRSLYWHGELLVPFGNHPAFRRTLGWLMPPKVSFLKLTQGKKVREFRDARNVVQDALVPLRHLKEAVAMFHREFECYPLWLCGHRTYRTDPPGMVQPSPGTEDWEMYVDVGAWQVPGFVRRGEPWDGHEAVRRMEAWCRDHHSYQCLYAVTEQTRDEFWQMFDPTLYRQVRAAYGADGAFLDVFDKVKRPDQA
ncbi:MAG TPA: FAD-binding protein [Polyangiaceae bacterium LLY-WYZ-14_1]|nr:FAD-binding protein [Polyangiaceae bacterium LLY-WYZ-14_1]